MTRSEAARDGITVPTNLKEYCIATKPPPPRSQESTADLDFYDDDYMEDDDEDDDDDNDDDGVYGNDEDSGNSDSWNNPLPYRQLWHSRPWQFVDRTAARINIHPRYF